MQVVEQDIQPFQEGETQQPTFSRTSSVASVVTIVDGRRDSQRDLSQGKQSSSATLQRDPSIRRSWRMTRDSRSNKLHSAELRGGSGELPADWGSGHGGYSGSDEPKPVISNDTDSSIQHHNRRDTDQTSKWMLNDDVEIVIGEAKGDLSGKSSDILVKEHMPVHSKETRTWKPDSDIIRMSNDSVKNLSTCKTSVNLAALGTSSGNDYSPSKASSSSLTSFLSRSGREPSADRLYPSLQELDDHRETFGPESIQPDVIAEKVKKLFHGSSTISTAVESYKDRPVTHTISCCSLPRECDWRDIPADELQSKGNITTLPRMKRSPTRSVSNNVQKEKAVDCSENRTKSFSCYVSKREAQERTLRNEITVPARDIQPEVEEGGKVLFLLGENERLEGLKSKSKLGENSISEPQSAWTNMKESTNAAAIGFEGFIQGANGSTGNIEMTKSEVQVVGRLPSPVDSRKVVKIRHVGRESARDLPSLEVSSPHHSLFSKDLQVCDNSVSRKCTTPKSERAPTARHHRRHSDPTNGAFISKAPLYPNIELLKDVVEEQVTECKDPSNFKKDLERKDVDDPSVKETPDSIPLPKEEFDEQTSKQHVSSDKTPEAVQDSNQEIMENSNEQPTVIQIPR